MIQPQLLRPSLFLLSQPGDTNLPTEVDTGLIDDTEHWFRSHRVRPHFEVTNDWVNHYSNVPYAEFREMVDSLVVLITKLNLMQLRRRRLSPLTRKVTQLQSFLQQAHTMLERKKQLRAWQRRGWITRSKDDEA